MGTLSRRGLFGVAGLLATASLAAKAAEAQEQFPPEGYMFCEACAGEGWQDRFGAEVDSRHDPARHDVLFNGSKHLWAFAGVSGSHGWIAEGVRDEPEEDGYRQLMTCPCRSDGYYHLQLRITYGNVEFIDHGKASV